MQEAHFLAPILGSPGEFPGAVADKDEVAVGFHRRQTPEERKAQENRGDGKRAQTVRGG